MSETRKRLLVDSAILCSDLGGGWFQGPWRMGRYLVGEHVVLANRRAWKRRMSHAWRRVMAAIPGGMIFVDAGKIARWLLDGYSMRNIT